MKTSAAFVALANRYGKWTTLGWWTKQNQEVRAVQTAAAATSTGGSDSEWEQVIDERISGLHALKHWIKAGRPMDVSAGQHDSIHLKELVSP